MDFIQYAGTKTALEKIPAHVFVKIPHPCISAMGFPKGPAQEIPTLLGDSNEMNMVGHQAPRQNLDSITASFFSDKVEVGFSICI